MATATTRRVLLVDDDARVLEALGRLLDGVPGLSVSAAVTSATAARAPALAAGAVTFCDKDGDGDALVRTVPAAAAARRGAPVPEGSA